MNPANGGPNKLPRPCTSKTRPYAQVKSSKLTKRTRIIGVKEKVLAKVSPKIVHNNTNAV